MTNPTAFLAATVEADTDTEAATNTFTYDKTGNVESMSDPEGNNHIIFKIMIIQVTCLNCKILVGMNGHLNIMLWSLNLKSDPLQQYHIL